VLQEAINQLQEQQREQDLFWDSVDGLLSAMTVVLSVSHKARTGRPHQRTECDTGAFQCRHLRCFTHPALWASICLFSCVHVPIQGIYIAVYIFVRACVHSI